MSEIHHTMNQAIREISLETGKFLTFLIADDSMNRITRYYHDTTKEEG